MTAEELMIGDWVNVFDVPKQIEGIRTFKNGDEMVYYDGDNGNFIKSVTPILLTEKILEKSGWKKQIWRRYKQSNVVTYDIANGFYLEVTYTGFALVDNCSDDGDYGYVSNWIADINYVHELQHALKLYGIKKEIIL